ncbi:Uncharacterised protein [Mycobacteroides abscessus subsp. abscessus]|nr:Uncharacterised protein [Mycobacteroides abscessus subsp. abscessus]
MRGISLGAAVVPPDTSSRAGVSVCTVGSGPCGSTLFSSDVQDAKGPASPSTTTVRRRGCRWDSATASAR